MKLDVYNYSRMKNNDEGENDEDKFYLRGFFSVLLAQLLIVGKVAVGQRHPVCRYEWVSVCLLVPSIADHLWTRWGTFSHPAALDEENPRPRTRRAVGPGLGTSLGP